MEFQLQHPSNEHPGLISFRMDWLDLLAVQGTLKSLLQYHSSKASILLCSAFFVVQLLHPYMTTGKTIALTRQTFVGKVMLHQPQASCILHQTWTGDSFHILSYTCFNAILLNHCPPPQSPNDCSIHLCLFCCLTYRVIVTLFLNSIYMH